MTAVSAQALLVVVENLLDKVLVAFANVSLHVGLGSKVAGLGVFAVLRVLQFVLADKFVVRVDVGIVADAGGGVGTGSVPGRVVHADAFVTCIEFEAQVLMHVVRVDHTTSAHKLVAIAAILHELGSPAFCRVDFRDVRVVVEHFGGKVGQFFETSPSWRVRNGSNLDSHQFQSDGGRKKN